MIARMSTCQVSPIKQQFLYLRSNKCFLSLWSSRQASPLLPQFTHYRVACFWPSLQLPQIPEDGSVHISLVLTALWSTGIFWTFPTTLVGSFFHGPGGWGSEDSRNLATWLVTVALNLETGLLAILPQS